VGLFEISDVNLTGHLLSTENEASADRGWRLLSKKGGIGLSAVQKRNPANKKQSPVTQPEVGFFINYQNRKIPPLVK